MSELREEKKTQQECNPIEPIGKYSNVSLAKFKEDVKMNGNFKVIATKGNDYLGVTKNKVYEFKNGYTAWDDGRQSGHYENFERLVKNNDSLGFKKAEFTIGESITIRRKKSKVIATLSIDGGFKYSQYVKLIDANGDFKTAVKMAVDRLMDKWDGGKVVDLTAVEANRQAEVGEYIKITNGERHKAKVDGIYKVESLDGQRFVNVKVESGSMQLIRNDQYVVVENPIKKVKRPAKVGEWIEVAHEDGIIPKTNGVSDYKKGDILKVIDIESDIAVRYKENADDGPYNHVILHSEYLVLENYTPEVVEVVAETPIAETPKFVKAKVGDKIRVVKDSRSHIVDFNIGDIQTVDAIGGFSDEGVSTTEGLVFYDKNEEYEIIKETPTKTSDKLVSNCTQEELIKELFNRQGL